MGRHRHRTTGARGDEGSEKEDWAAMVVVVESRYASPVFRSEVVGYDSGSLAIK